MDKKKTRIVTVKFSPDEYEMVLRGAGKSKTFPSSFIRDSALGGVQRKEWKAAERMQCLVRIQDGINELRNYADNAKADDNRETKDKEGFLEELIIRMSEEVRLLWEFL